MVLSFTIAAGPRQRSHFQVRVPRGSWPHFNVSDSRLPLPGGPGPRIYNPQEQGGPVISPGTGFHFRRLLRLAWLRSRYSTPPPQGCCTTHVASRGIRRKHIHFIEMDVYCYSERACTDPLPSDGCPSIVEGRVSRKHF
jgi:hypothetical protein